ncbi:MAG TPA: UbiX family flavin prenyltransferase [Vicinamibacterales bacterium]|nr:UbiX family flavin prenyltransferase [Vicinamibacterales bacterium]
MGIDRMRLIVAITGATGVIYGVRLLQRLREADVETHVVISKWGVRTLLHETSYSREQVEALATEVYAPNDMGAAIASGSFQAAGMIIAPCSVKTLGAIAHGYGDSLVHRAADVTLKERRKLLLSVREAPLSEIHLENMLKLARMGAVILPPMPAFYMHPQTLDEVIDHTVLRMLDQFGIDVPGAPRWDGDMGVNRPVSRERS